MLVVTAVRKATGAATFAALTRPVAGAALLHLLCEVPRTPSTSWEGVRGQWRASGRPR